MNSTTTTTTVGRGMDPDAPLLKQASSMKVITDEEVETNDHHSNDSNGDAQKPIKMPRRNGATAARTAKNISQKNSIRSSPQKPQSTTAAAAELIDEEEGYADDSYAARDKLLEPQSSFSFLLNGYSSDDTAYNDILAAGSPLRHRPSRRRRSSVCPESSPFTPRKGKDLIWQNVNMRVKGSGKRPDQIILNQVWGEVPRRQTTAIMGPSGSGKTSLLNILSGRVRSHGRLNVQAAVRLDNHKANLNSMAVRQLIAFVAQDDSLPSTETPREAIWFSAKLRLGRSLTDAQLEELTEYMLRELGLLACADTIVGNLLLKGISGGERKRTSIGVELVVKPAMVFLDEPTSGLDSFSAVLVCRLLKKVAKAGASVMFTIHQPSSKIFREFDNLILLRKGRVMYQGPVGGVPGYFAARGHPCPDNYNPSDWIMKIAQQVPVEKLEQDGFFPKDERELSKPTPPLDGRDALGRKISKHLFAFDDTQQPYLTQLKMLVWREWKHVKRDQNVAIARVLVPAVMALLIGVIFFDVGQSSTGNLSNVQSQFGAIVLLTCTVMMAPAQQALLAFPEERPIFLREYSTKHYSVAAYFTARLIVEFIVGLAQCMSIVFVGYYLINFKSSFIIFFGACFLLSLASTAVAVIIGAAAGSMTKIAAVCLPLVLMPQLLFVGYLVTPDLIPVWLRWLNYLCPMSYATRLIAIDEFHECSEDLFKNLGCELLLLSIKADPAEQWWYWLILACQFVVFRIVALKILHASAGRFY